MSNSLVVRYIYFFCIFCIDKFNFYGISVRWQHHYREYEVVAFHFLPRLQKLQYLSFVTTPKWWVCSILQPFYMLRNYLGWLNCRLVASLDLGAGLGLDIMGTSGWDQHHHHSCQPSFAVLLEALSQLSIYILRSYAIWFV